MTDAAHIPIRGGYLIQNPNGRVAPFRCRDYATALALLRMHPHATLTHYEAHRRWRIYRALDGVCVSEALPAQ